MPKRPSAKNLKEWALNCVAQNIEEICYGYNRGSKELAKFYHEEQYLEVEGPFVDWPSSLLEELVAHIYTTRSGHRHFLHLLIQPHINNFSVKLHGSTQTALTLLVERCGQSLKTLELIYNSNLPPMLYIEYLGKFPNLTKLNVYSSLIDDMAFGKIGKYCDQLIELNAGGTWISNIGAKNLSIAPNSEGDNIDVSLPVQFRLPQLSIVDLSYTKVTTEGISMMLSCHPKLVKMVHNETFHAFQFKITEGNKHPVLLRNLSSVDVCLLPEEFEFALNCCPRIESITITSAGLINENLYQLMNLKNLSQLHLGNKNCQSFNFYEGVAPVLEGIGLHLTKLVLEEFTEIDVDYIGSKCPQLQHLAFSGILTYAPTGQSNTYNYFTKLCKLEIWNKYGQENEWLIGANVLKQLLCRAPLNYLLLQRIGNFNDDLFASILQVNPLLSLRNIVIDYCHNVTERIIWMLLEQPNNLEVLRCWHCKGVPEETRKKIRQTVSDENLQLYWEYYPYNEYEELLDAGQIVLDDTSEGEEEDEDD